MNHTITLERHYEMLMTAFGSAVMSFMDDDSVVEIIVNPDGKLWIESLTRGKYSTDVVLLPEKVANVIKLVAAYRNTVADIDHPEVSCDLPVTGARFQGWLPPVVEQPTFTIRKKAVRVFTLTDYVKAGALSSSSANFLSHAIKERKNILIAGGTGSGKTTFANALLHELKETNERLIVLEDLPELQIVSEDHVKLRTTDSKSMRDLVKGVLRMRPDRIIIGEVRDGAALELLKAWNTGHPGGICTIHANSPTATIARLEDLIQEAVSVVPTRLIEQAIDLVVFMRREHGKYRVDSIHRYEEQEGVYCLLPL